MTSQEARLHALLGDDAGDLPRSSAADAAWADGYGVVAPDVARYVEVLRSTPDALKLAMQNLAADLAVEIVDPDTATTISLLSRSHRPRQVLEVGTGLGYVTLHLARTVPDHCTITSIESDPTNQERAHAFLSHEERECATELRLGDPRRVLREHVASARWDMVVLTDAHAERLDIVDIVAPRMEPDALLVIPWALRKGLVADSEAAWNGDELLERQRLLNRSVATDPRFDDVVLLPVGDGLLLARRV